MQRLLVIFAVVVAVAAVTAFAAPHQGFPKNLKAKQLDGNLGFVGDESAVQEGEEGNQEESQLESLKLNQTKTEPITSFTSTEHPLTTNTKKPENEEKAQISDNANSLKFSTHNSGNIDFSKKNQQHHLPKLYPTIDLLGEDISSLKDYTPQDIAEYIFWTGQDHRVAVAVKTFLEEGLITREEALRFLEDVKRELASLRSRYSGTLGLQNTQGSAWGSEPVVPSIVVGSPQMAIKDFHLSVPKRESNSNSGNYPQEEQGQAPSLFDTGAPQSMEEMEDYEEIVDKLRSLDAKMRESVLEDVIYQMAKDKFETMKNSGAGAVKTLSSFIENQSAKMPKDLEKDILEVLLGAYVDAVGEELKEREAHGHGSSTKEKMKRKF